MKLLLYYYCYEHTRIVRVVKMNFRVPACTESMQLAEPIHLRHTSSKPGSSNAGNSTVISFTDLCHSPTDFSTANTLETSWHKITTAALTPVEIKS